MPDTLYLVDGSSILYRAFFAIRHLSTHDGRPTNAIFGTLKMAQKLLKDHSPSHIAFIFDTAAPTFRHEAFEAYKANRPDMPDDMAVQITPAKDILRAMGLPVLEMDGYEADDLIGTLAGEALEAGMETIIVTADKDMFQLVRKGVRILHTKKEDAVLDEKGVEEVFGVPPNRVVDVLALWGDPTDNIPGVPGIGEKGAKQLVQQFGGLEDVLAHADEVKRKAYREGLQEHADQARQSRELATIKTDVPLEWSPADLHIGDPDHERLVALCTEHEFESLLREFLQEAPSLGVKAEEESWEDGLLDRLAGREAVGLAWNDGEAWLSDGETAWKGTLEQAAGERTLRLPLCVHGYKALLHRTRTYGMDTGRGVLDAAVVGYLLNPSGSVPSVAKLSTEVLMETPVEGDHAAESLLLARLRAPLRSRLDELAMAGLYDAVERPLIEVLARMEAAGVLVDRSYFEGLSVEMTDSLKALEGRIYQAAGTEFNVASPKQVGEVLFEKLGLPVRKRTSKTKSYSTDNEVLESLKPAHPVVAMILEHRLLSKLKGTYVDALPACIDAGTGRVHATFHQTVTATGRLSSSDPNLQNIPVKGEWGARIRKGFTAAPGCLLVGADYSQIELRMLAHLSEDPVLLKIFERGEDIHTTTASEVFDVAPGFVDADMRRQAKVINFGILYGMGPFGLSRELGVPQKEAKAFIGRYFDRFPSVKAYLDGVQEQVMLKEEVTTVLGRRRLFPGIGRAPKPAQQALLRQAVNTTVQGSAADLIKKAMIAADERLPEGCRLILQVHDELIVEAPEEKSDEAADILRASMEGAMKLRVPLTVTLATGRRWSDLK